MSVSDVDPAGLVIDPLDADAAAAARRSEQVGRSLAHISEGVVVIDPDWTMVYANERAAQLLGVSAASLLGLVLWERFPESVDTEFWPAFHDAMDNHHAREIEAFYGPLNGWYRVRAIGSPDGITVYFENIDEHIAAREAQQEQARNLLAALRSREAIAQAQGILMERGAMTADEAFVHLRRASQRLNVKLKDVALDLVETGEDPLASVNPSIIPANEAARSAAVRRYDILDTPPDGAFDRVAALAARLCETPIAIISIVDSDRIWFKSHHGTDVAQVGRDPGLCASAILQDDPWIVENAPADPRTLANPLVAGESGFGFYLGIPLRTHDGYNLGALCVLDRDPRPATDRNIADLTELAHVVIDELELRLAARRTVLLEARLRHEAEVLATEVQASLLPPRLPELADLELSAHYLPAQRERVGGDFYDAFASGPSYGLVMGDVCGHGSPAAALANMARHTVRALATDDWSPRSVVEHLNQAIARAGSGEDRQFCTIAMIRLDRGEQHMTMKVTLGGHPCPVVLRADGSVEPIGATGTLVGPFPDAAFDETAFELSLGDTLILYTDGLTDARGGFDEAHLHRTLSSFVGLTADQVAQGILTALDEREPDPRDDIAILVARVTGPHQPTT